MSYNFLTILFIMIFAQCNGQTLTASNIISRTIEDKIEIFYDLPRNRDTLEVKVYFCKKSDPKIKYRLKWVTGSIGVGRFSGRKQKVVWSYKKEPAYLFTGSGFYYKVIAKKTNKPF